MCFLFYLNFHGRKVEPNGSTQCRPWKGRQTVFDWGGGGGGIILHLARFHRHAAHAAHSFTVFTVIHHCDMWLIVLSFLFFLISIPALSQYSLRACPHCRWVLSWCKFREGESATDFEPQHTHASICPTIINLRKILYPRLMDNNDHLCIVIVIGSPTT
jgi:hypothetical protein